MVLDCFIGGLLRSVGFDDYYLNYYFIIFRSFFGDSCFYEPISLVLLGFFYKDIFLAEFEPNGCFTPYLVLILGVCLEIYLFLLISLDFIDGDYWFFLGEGFIYFDIFGVCNLLVLGCFIKGLGYDVISLTCWWGTYLIDDFWGLIGVRMSCFVGGN